MNHNKCYSLEELKQALQSAARGDHTRFYAIAPEPFDLAHRWLGLDIIHLGKDMHSVVYYDHDMHGEPQTINGDTVMKAAEQTLEVAQDYHQHTQDSQAKTLAEQAWKRNDN